MISDVQVRLKARDPARPDPGKPDPHAGLWRAQGSGVDSEKPKPWAFGPMISVGIERHLISCNPLLISDHSFLLDSHVHIVSVSIQRKDPSLYHNRTIYAQL